MVYADCKSGVNKVRITNPDQQLPAFGISRRAEILDKITSLYGLTIDQIVHPENGIPKEVTIEDKGLLEQVKLIQELEEKDRNTVFNIIDTMLTKAKFKDFFNKNIAAL
ncbi:hypothetical protein [Mangrovibacterium sp.]|uniref:hypothetical protein n=1 Tax=Mangrovibacterium sp. TaxID=1961364 RepID=UPI003566105A